MGAQHSAPVRLQPRDALALCEDGDLLLAREALAHRMLRLRMDAAVARDVGRAQRGQLPQRLATRLPGWTRCENPLEICWSSELLARRGGQLMVLRVRADGVHLEPLMDRLTSGDHFAVRRLRSEAFPAFVRELVEEIAAVAPLRWPQLLEPPRASATSLPIFTSVLRRALELSRAGLQTAAGSGGGSDTLLTEALGAADPAEALGILNAAFVVAVYECLGVVSCTDLSIRLSPMSLATVVSEDYEHISLEALGPEMRLDVSKECES